MQASAPPAKGPWAMSGTQWWAVLRRTWAETSADNIGLIAAGTAFYAFAAIVPMLGAVVLLYGLVADAATVAHNVRSLFTILPADVARLIGEQLTTVTRTSGGKKGLGLAVALALALYGATKGSSSIITALNIAYEEKEKRGFVMLNLLALGVVIGAVVLILAGIAATAALHFLGGLMPHAPGFVLTLIPLIGYVVLAALVMTAAACLYRFGPSHSAPRWAWLSPGALAATLLWMAGTTGFGLYVAHFGNYGATYGSLGAVIVLLTWLWLSAYVFLLGAELNSELEHPAAAPAPVSVPTIAAAPPAPDGVLKTAVQVKTASRVTGRKSGLPSALLAGAGLSTLRRGSKAGVALLGVAATLAWIGRTRD